MTDELGACPDPEFARLSDFIREWRPDFKVGDRVVRKRGTLGNMDGLGPVGVVASLYWRGTHIMAQIVFPSGAVEDFIADVYEVVG